MSYAFGKAFTYNFFALADDEFENLNDAVFTSAYVYKTGYQPTRAEAAAGTDNGGLLQTISSWKASIDGNGRALSLSAIDDPDPTSGIRGYLYWIAVNFRFAAGAQVQTTVRALPMQRIDVWHKSITVTRQDLISVWPKIDSYISEAEQVAAIAWAKELTERDFEAEGFEWALIWRPDRLSIAVTYRAIAHLMLGLAAGTNNTSWIQMSDAYNESYKTLTKTLALEYAATEADEPTVVERQGEYRRIIT